MSRINKNIHLLKTLSNCKPCLRKNLLAKSSKDTIGAICEIIDNLLHNNIPLSQNLKERLRKHKGSLRKLIKKSQLSEKKKILIQHGGFLQYIIPAAISAISSILSDAIAS